MVFLILALRVSPRRFKWFLITVISIVFNKVYYKNGLSLIVIPAFQIPLYDCFIDLSKYK